jgi:uncharacterized protein (TIRG00374 family)
VSDPESGQEEPKAEQPLSAAGVADVARPDGGAPQKSSGPGATSGASDDISERLASRIEKDVASPPAWRTVLKAAVAAVVAGVTIYFVFPTLIAVFGSWPKLKSLNLLWFLVALVAQVAHFTCTIALQRLALRTKAWFSVATSQLAGNAISLVVPGGQAAGAATQFRMLAASGSDPATAVGGLTAISILGIGGLLALPIFVLPAIIAGTPIDRGLEHAALLGIGAFFLFAGFSAVVLIVDGPMHWAGRVIQAVRNKVLRKRPPMTGLPDKLVNERNRIRVVLGHQWKAALLLSSGRLAFDFITLLACIWATGTKPQPSLILLAYAVAGLLGLIPITPGGLGIVEAGLSGMLILAGLPGGAAVLATLAYRIISYWLPALAGPVAYGLFRARYGAPGHPNPPASPAAAAA